MTDFVVIGGGIAGISAAARLSHLGHVTVLEAEAGLGYHTSGRSAAMFEETYGKPTTVALNRASREYFQTANGGVLSPRGLMLLGRKTDGDAFEEDLSTMAMQRITVDEARTMIPVLDPATVTMAAYHAEAWDIDTDRLIQNFAREVRQNGGEVLTGRKVSAISRTDTGWIVRAEAEEWQAEILVNAAGSWVDDVAVMAGIKPLGVTPLRRSMARIPAPGGHDVSGWPMAFGTGESWYCKPDAGLLFVSPAVEDPSHPHDAWPDDMVLAEGLARYEEFVIEPVTRLDSSWAGLRTFAPDRSLVLGPDADDPGFIWVAGQGGYGFQTSPAASRLIADLVAGRPSELDATVVNGLSPKRFRSG